MWIIKFIIALSFEFLFQSLNIVFWIIFVFVDTLRNGYKKEYKSDLATIFFLGLFFLAMFLLGWLINLKFFVVLGLIFYFLTALFGSIFIRRKWGKKIL